MEREVRKRSTGGLMEWRQRETYGRKGSDSEVGKETRMGIWAEKRRKRRRLK